MRTITNRNAARFLAVVVTGWVWTPSPAAAQDRSLDVAAGYLNVSGLQLAIPDQSQYEGLSGFPRVTTGVVIRLKDGH